MRPHHVERRAPPVLPSKHEIRLQVSEGEVIPLRKGLEASQIVSVLHDLKIIVTAPSKEQLAVELKGEHGREGDRPSYRQIERAGVTGAEDRNVVEPVIDGHDIRQDGAQRRAVVDRHVLVGGKLGRSGGGRPDAPDAARLLKRLVGRPGEDVVLPLPFQVALEGKARTDVPITAKTCREGRASVVMEAGRHLRLDLPAPPLIRLDFTADLEHRGCRPRTQSPRLVGIVSAERVLDLRRNLDLLKSLQHPACAEIDAHSPVQAV